MLISSLDGKPANERSHGRKSLHLCDPRPTTWAELTVGRQNSMSLVRDIVAESQVSSSHYYSSMSS